MFIQHANPGKATYDLGHQQLHMPPMNFEGVLLQAWMKEQSRDIVRSSS
jgi:hypothetical protein